MNAAPQIQSDTPYDNELSEEEARQIKTAERFFSILEKNPRRGTALDRVYGHHVEFGSLDEFLDSLRERSQQSADDGAAWMLLGLFEAQRGNDAAAAQAFVQAERLRPTDAMASYYLGQSQLRIGQSEEAIASFERGIERNPPRADVLEIYQQLGRVHQRAQRTDEALNVWQRLEALFPDDPRVLEQIAVTLAEEGQPELALPRYEKLATLVRDDYRRVMFQVAAAELRIKAGQRDVGIASFESVLGNLNPESWLYRDVRRRIDDVFLRSGDQDGLVKYYQAWLEGHPEDVEGMSRLARFLASSARVPEASQWMEKALKLAPSRTDLRKTFIDQLVNDQRYPEAIQQYEQLVSVVPGNADFLRDWGKLVLRNKEQPEEQRRKEAARIWNQILQTRPDDALTVSQVADLYRQNNMFDQAEQLYRKAVELAPADPQYREYLGEFLHVQKRPDEAIVVWSGIAAGDRRNAINMTRLAEVYNSFGFPEKAVIEIAEAVTQAAKDFSLQLRAADYHSRAGKFDEALAYVENAEQLVSSDDERDAVIQQRIDILQTSQRLDDEAERLAEQIRADENATSAQWYLLARYLESNRRWSDASAAIDNAIRLDPKSIAAFTVAARIAEASGDYGRAAETSRKLAKIDRRSRGDHLMNVSRLETQLGRADEALKAAEELILSAPGNTDNYEFYAQTCFRLGKPEDGLEALRKAVRINPNEPHLITALASALADQLRTDEAIEVYWRAFEKTDEVEDKVGLTMKLAPLYERLNQFDKLIERFERDRRSEDKRRELTICLAQAWHTTGDFGAARQELESLLSEDTRDTNLLNQLAKLCQDGADLDAAIGYQRQLVAIAPGHETEFPLAGMLMSSGQTDEAREIFVKLTQREEDPVRQMKSLDSLLTQGNYESVINVIEPLLAQKRDDWELLYREAVAWASLEKFDEAKLRLERLLSLTLPYDSLGRSAEAKLKQARAKAKSDNLRGVATVSPQRQSPLAMRSMSNQVQRSCGLIADNYYYAQRSTPPVWSPDAYGVARMAAYGWLLKFEDDANFAATVNSDDHTTNQHSGSTASLAATVHERAQADDASREAIYDSLYVAQLKNDYPTIFKIARRLAKDGGAEEQRFFLSSLNTRQVDPAQSGRSSSQAATANKKPLSEDDLELARTCYEALTREDNQVDLAAIYGGNVAYGANGQVYVMIGGGYTMLPGVFRGEGGFLTQLADELRLAGKTDEANQLLIEHLQKAGSATQLAEAMSLLLKEDRLNELEQYLGRWKEAALKQIAEAPVKPPTRGSSRQAKNQVSASVLPSALNSLQQWMGRLGPEEENAQVLAVIETALDVAVAEAKHRRLVEAAQTRKSTSKTSSLQPVRMTIYFGKEATQSTISFPPASTYIDQSAITLLKQAHEVLQRNDVASDLVDALRKRLSTSSKSAMGESQENTNGNDQADRDDETLYNQLYLASVLWWMEEQDEAVELMASVVNQLPDDLDIRFNMAQMYESRGDFEDAMTLIESITPRDQQVLQRRELMALHLAERLGDIDRARSAAERLFGLRLSSQIQLTLVDRMRRLGLNELADAVLARVERTSSNQTSSLASLMMLYQGQGKMDQANQLAHMLLRRTTSPLSVNSRSSRNPLRYRTSDSSQRTQALQLLQRSGELKSLIERLQVQYERSPDSVRLLEQLIEFYGVAGQKAEAVTLLQQGIEHNPDSATLRLQLAKHYEQTGKMSEACDQYLELLKLQPDWVTSELYQVERVFTQAKRKLDLVKAITKINFKSISQPYYLANIASNLLQDDENADVAIALLERAFDAFPQYRQNLVRNVRNEAIWKNERFYRFAKRLVLPSELDVMSNPWVGLSEINSYSSNGEVNVFFHKMIAGLKSSDRLADLEKSIDELAKQQPQWMSGRAMLALIELSTDRKKAARARLQALISDEAAMESITTEACWIIGQELNRFEETQPTAMMLFEKAVASPSQNSMNQIQYSPVVKLVDSYAKAGRRDEARELLIQQMKGSGLQNYDPGYAAYQRLENEKWVAGKMLEMKFPVDAIRIYRKLLDHPEALASAKQYSGRTAEYHVEMLEKGMSKAVASMDGSNANELVSQLLVDPESSDSSHSAIDLMLSIPDAKDLANQRMKSSLVELLTTLSKESQVSSVITDRLDQLAEQYPLDLSIAVASAAWKLSSEDDEAVQAVRQLTQMASKNPLEQIAEGRRPNSRQRREAAMMIPVWIVARDCIKHDELQDLGHQLAEVALKAARRQIGIKEQSAILYEWGRVLVEQGNKAQAEARWAELLEIATQRPTRSKDPKASFRRQNGVMSMLASISIFHRIGFIAMQLPPGLPTQSLAGDANPAARSSRPKPQNSAKLISPLTLSQFRTAVTIAKSAAENDMPELSRRAVSESLKGGFPVADPVAESPDNSRGSFIVHSSSSEPNDADPIETEVITSLKEIVSVWNGNDYPVEDTYDVLKALVMPANRPSEILMYVTVTDLMDVKIDSLAFQLVMAAKGSDRLPELLEAVNQRTRETASTIPSIAMKTLIAAAQNDRVDDSIQLLNDLTAKVSTGAASADKHVALLAALKAFENEKLKAAAFPIIHQTLQQSIQQATANSSGQFDGEGKLPRLVNTYLASTGDEQSVKDYFESLLMGRQAYYSRFSGDHGLYQQMRDLGTITSQAAELGMPQLTLDLLGRLVDFELPNYSRPRLPTPLAIVSQHLKSGSADQRYSAWHEWTMPTAGREAIRFTAELIHHAEVPKVFLEQTERKTPANSSVLLSNFTELVNAARDAGTLDQLRSEVDVLAEKKSEHAEFLQTLTMIAQNDVELGNKNVEKLLSSMKERLKSGTSRVRPNAAAEYLVYQACLASESFAPLFENRLPAFRKQLLDASQTAYARLANVDWSNRVTAATKQSDLPLDRPFEHWLVTSSEDAGTNEKAWWAGYEGQITNLSGRSHDLLYFNYPLAGDFTVSMDCIGDPSAEGGVGYGGIVVSSNRSNTAIRSVSGHDSITHSGGRKRASAGVNRVTVQVKDGQAKYFMNKYLVYEEAVGTTSPWLTLASEGTRVVSFHNIRIEGSPVIPRQVDLFSADRMDGWDCTKFSESQPRKRLMAENPTPENSALAYYQQQEPSTFDWNVQDGVLEGHASEASGDPAEQSWIYYHRPLQNGDSVQYEFFYTPEKSVAHPTIGRIALMLQPDGVETHWIATPKWDDDYNGVELDNSLVEASCRRGTAPLPLKVGDWNQVELTLRDGAAVVSVNGSVVFERPLDAELSTRFGIYRSKHQSSKVRNAVLTGDWPTELSDQVHQHLTALANPPTDEQVRVVATIVDDATVEPLTAEIVRTTRDMPSDQAFGVLRDWVLPSASHSNLRLYYAIDNPMADSAAVVNQAQKANASVPTTRFDTVLCPAIELVRLAKATGKLDDLRTIIEQLHDDSDLQSRNRQAIEALIAIESGDKDATKAAVTEVWKTLIAGIPQSLSAADRAAEFVVAWRAAQDESTRTTASDIVRELRKIERDEKRRSNDQIFSRHVHALFGDIENAERLTPSRVTQSIARPLSQWTQVPYFKPDLKSQGCRPSTWIAAKGSLQHIPGAAWSQLYFQSPLRGQFEIVAEHSTYGHREVSIAYGMHAAQPLHDLSKTQVTTVMHDSKRVGEKITLPAWDPTAETRIKVDGNKVTTWTNGVQIHEQTFDHPPAPWLVLQSSHPSNYSTVNNLRIIGTPEIPSEINLIDMERWAAWRADVYGEFFSTIGDGKAPWKRVGDELTGQLRENTSVEHLESLLLYQRPMLEDGVIEFETWYEKDKFEVHPALGPNAYLISPSGIRLHRLTNAQYEASDLNPGNESPLPASATEVPLKEKAWNKIRMTLKGDALTISVNDVDVAKVAVEVVINERQFALFRYSNKTECRVRNLVHRGEWPKTLPTVNEQELAYPAEGPFALNAPSSTLDVSLDQPLEKLKSIGINVLGSANQFAVGDDGLRITQQDSDGYPTWPGIARWKKVHGDMEVTVDYRDVEISPNQDGWGINTGLSLSMDDPEKTRVDCQLSLNKDAQLVYRAQIARYMADGKNHTYDSVTISNASKSGRLRMVREGGQIHCLVAPAEAAPFRLLASFAVGDTAISGTFFQSKCSDSVGRSEITLEKLTIHEKSPVEDVK
ncbi:DUF1583 domain-containing protein [Novipirellula caenicola]|uniref:DUF1583 domain-containing protein n=1 Tax=Novipirellula caenicola TaxID=1536901 RepID=UPI0031ED0F19